MVHANFSPQPRNQRKLIFASAPGLEAAETLFDAIPNILFCVKDRNRRYIAANEAFIRRVGLKHRKELFGKSAKELFPPVLAAGYEQDDEQVFTTGTPIHDRLEMITKTDGSMSWFVSQKVPVKSVHGGIIAVSGISKDLGKAETKGTELGAIAESLEILRKDYAQPLRIEELAKNAGMSWSQFQRRIYAITGLTPRQLLSKSRIEAAAKALQNSDDSLSAIDCGFYDQAAFSRQFSAATGLSPGQYRRAAREL